MIATDYLLDKFGLTIITDVKLPSYLDAIIVKNNIYTKPGMSEKEQYCVIAEEVSHKIYTAGNILEKRSVSNEKQEVFAKRKTFDYLISLESLIECNNLGMRDFYEVADHLNITEEFLRSGIEYYKEKYGIMHFDKKTQSFFYFGSTIQIFKEDHGNLLEPFL
ncbi:hypothetical protein JH67_02835 [Listeria monocytogenes]|nr:hypothetical protein [Listeria monocytogenes]